MATDDYEEHKYNESERMYVEDLVHEADELS